MKNVIFCICTTYWNTCIEDGDEIILSTTKYTEEQSVELYELPIDTGHEWCNKKISELDMKLFQGTKEELLINERHVLEVYHALKRKNKVLLENE